ncbi:cupin-like domain-containing protein [Phanerochaete sordida]|uniref:Cupin-like domain-containing protein n=1 Tax=Phanerochaete sordida TaxID=48140 RepID=A0A9P3GBF7_9APHY|nr:cupin-like domain-containing protein [Phanerochaete sordida]
MAKYPQPGSTVPSVSAEEFFSKYISKRVPVIVKGLLDDADFKGRNWADLDYLASKAGEREVLVEPMHPDAHQFGTDVERVNMKFGDFLKSLQSEDGPHHYLTTQYAEQDLEALTVLPPPTDALEDEFPYVPRIMGNLCLQQVNLWVGRSKEGSTSGLHHDFHDNLYCLLKGRKRFVLFPPSELPHLYPHGTLDAQHPNGLISYTDAPVRADGLPVRVALKARVRALEARLDAAPRGKGKGRMDVGARAALVEAHEQALDELAQYTLEAADGIDVDEEEDDFDALMAGLEGEDDFDILEMDGGGPEGGDVEEAEDESDQSEEEEEYPEWHGIGTAESDDEESDEDGEEPSSFSRIPTGVVHKHLGLPTTAVPPEGASLKSFPNFKKATKPFVVELSAGEMLYLPASWWHEVTSSAAADGDAVHMAFNYWFYPPDNLDSFEEPYEDSLVWEYLRSKNPKSQRKAPTKPPAETAKRKSNGDGAQAKKKSKK